jgi:hypothetical protein
MKAAGYGLGLSAARVRKRAARQGERVGAVAEGRPAAVVAQRAL